MRATFATIHGAGLAEDLAGLINRLIRGEDPPALAPVIAGARLVAGTKKDSDDIRPLAAGEYYRRLASRYLCDAQRREIKAALGPDHCGDATPSGAEVMVFGARAWIAARATRHRGRSRSPSLSQTPPAS